MPQYRVGEAMAREDRRAPVQALVLLGDNFYGHGLAREDAEATGVRENLAGPYCHFLMLTHEGAPRVPQGVRPRARGDASGAVHRGHRQPRRRARAGRALQRDGIPRYVGNWLMPEEARSYELGAGVSLIAYHSQPITDGQPAVALERALRESKGPWRILTAHHPDREPGRRLAPRRTRSACSPRSRRRAARAPLRSPATSTASRRCSRRAPRSTSSRAAAARDPPHLADHRPAPFRRGPLRLRARRRDARGARRHAPLAVRPLRQQRRAAREVPRDAERRR